MKITTKNITLLATIAGAFTLASCTNNSALIVPDGAKRVAAARAGGRSVVRERHHRDRPSGERQGCPLSG